MLIWIKLWVARNFSAKALFENSSGQLTLQWPLQPTWRSIHMITKPVLFPPRMDPHTHNHNLEPTTDWKFFIQRNFTCSFTLFPQQKFPMFFGESASPGAKHQTWRRASNLEAPKDGRDGYKLHSVFHRGDGKKVKSDEICLLTETSTYQEVY